MNLEHLPEHARPAAAAFAGGLHSLGADWLVGVYVLGSVALGDYQPDRSDLDVVVVTHQDLSSGQVQQIRKLHTYSRRPRLNGVYIPHGALIDSSASAGTSIVAFDGGRVWRATQMLNPIQRHELATRAIVLFGPDARGLVVPPNEAELKQWVRQNMNDYWAAWVDRATRRPIDAIALVLFSRLTAWGVLGVSRQVYTLREGGVVSKTQAGDYALEHAAPEHHRILREALRIRRGGAGGEYSHRLARRLDTLRYMRDVITQYGRAAQ